MIDKSIGFIGAGRIVRIFLGGFERVGIKFKEIVASDIDQKVLGKLAEKFGYVKTSLNDNAKPACCDIVFIALHPPVAQKVLPDIKGDLKPSAIVISLAPKLTVSQTSQLLSGFDRIVRVIPNACSIVNEGYNPIFFSPSLNEFEKDSVFNLLKPLGEAKGVLEDTLEAYAILTAMGPTYFWFQLDELKKLGESFGLKAEDVASGLSYMLKGLAKLMFESGLSYEEITDLIPLKPLSNYEANIREVYKGELGALYNKLKVK